MAPPPSASTGCQPPTHNSPLSPISIVSTSSNRSVRRLASGAIVHSFIVPGAGGGFLAIDSFSDNGTTAGGIRMGALGVHYQSKADAEADACKLASAMHEKNGAANLGFGGCKTVLFTENENVLKEKPGVAGSLRARLFDALADVLVEYKDKILVGPDMFTTRHDLAYLRSVLMIKCPSLVHCPVPKQLTGDEDVVSVATAWSTLGFLVAIAKAKGWAAPKIAIQGLGNVGGMLAVQAQEKGWTVVGYDPVASRMDVLKEANKRTADTILFEECDILVPCARGNVLTPEVVKSLRCKAVAGAANCQIPKETDGESRALLEKRGIDYMNEIGVNCGGVAFACHAFENTAFTYDDAFELGKHNAERQMHESSVIKQYDPAEKREFYRTVMGDGTDNIHFGLWDGVDIDQEGAYGKASVNMTNWMWAEAMKMTPQFEGSNSRSIEVQTIRYADLGSGTGSASRMIVGRDERVSATCLNLCRNQNNENRSRADELGLSNRIEVVQGTYERMPERWTGLYDGCFSQDAFVHAYSKYQALTEAWRVTRGGGWLVLSDLHCGDGPDVSAEELHTFAETNMVNDWQTPEEMVATAQRAGWVDVRFVDLTDHIRTSFLLMLRKVMKLIQTGKHQGIKADLLDTYKKNLAKRVGQVEKGVFKWGAILARKPFKVHFTRQPPVTPEPNVMCTYNVADNFTDPVPSETNVLVITITDRMNAAAIRNLPKSVRVLISLSAGLDHIDHEAATANGIAVLQAGREAITNAVAEYLVGTTILTLRDTFSKIGMPFPGSGWDLSWNAEGIDLHESVIGVIGMGRIAITFIRQLRGLTNTARVVYTDRPGMRNDVLEKELKLEFMPLRDIMSTADVVIPLCALTSETNGLLKYDELCLMKRTSALINASRGKVCDTASLTRVMQEGRIRHAFLDCTNPEPLPAEHPLWKLKNVTITPHYATNTKFVRKALVQDVSDLLTNCKTVIPKVGIEAEEKKLRHELAVAHAITRKFGMDELVWNHISARMSDGSILITPGRMMFDEITGEKLVKSSDNVTADIIHQAIYEARPDVGAIVHLHTPATVAVSCLEDGFVAMAQEAAYVYGKVAEHNWQGVSDDAGEKAAIAAAVNKLPGCNTLLMRNHGSCSFGETVAEAWMNAFWFDKSCATQLRVLATGRKARIPSHKLMAHAAKQCELPEWKAGECEWAALERMVARDARNM